MVKKIVSVIICAVIAMAAVVPFAAYAADTSEFRLCVESQDSKTVTVTVDYAKGTGFSALDLSIEYNKLKLSLEDCQFASGFAAFKKQIESQGSSCMFMVNKDKNPVMVGISTITPYKIIDGDGSIIKLKFSKIEGANISESDISVSVDNCQLMSQEDYSLSDIKATVSYDLTSGASSSASDETVEGGQLPEESSGSSEETSEKSTATDADTSASSKTDASSANQADDGAAEASGEQQATKVEKGISNSKKTAVFVIVAIIGAAAVAALVTVIIKSKKSDTGLDK